MKKNYLQLTIGWLYPQLLNIYGDRGNIMALSKRCQWREIKVKIKEIKPGQKIKPKSFDLFFGGGGQDWQQLKISTELQKQKEILISEANRGVPMLLICACYQLFGHYFLTNERKKIKGISLFDAITIASQKRKIGNILVKTKLFKNKLNYPSTLVGFENHSGCTFINPLEKQKGKYKTRVLAKVIIGFGNNGIDKTEGAIYKNTIGTYLHGPILPKNPHLTDWLIEKALEIKYQKKIILKKLINKEEWLAHYSTFKKFPFLLKFSQIISARMLE